jgi:hypothetical protein
MNQQVLGNLDRIINALEDEDSAPERVVPRHSR